MFRFSKPSNILSASTKAAQNLYVPRFRCPICHAGKPFVLEENTNNNKNNTRTWLTGPELDQHLTRDLSSHRKLRREFVLNRKKKNENTNSSSPSSSSSPYFDRRKFNGELRAALSSLPNSSLVDR